MKAYCVVTLPATLNVFEMVMPELIEASTVAEVPPNGITHEMPAAGAEVNGAVAKNPVPMQVEFAPASPMVRNTKMKRRYHGTAVMLIGIVTVRRAKRRASDRAGLRNQDHRARGASR